MTSSAGPTGDQNRRAEPPGGSANHDGRRAEPLGGSAAAPDRPNLETLKIITWAILVAAPIVYLIVAQVISPDLRPTVGQDLLLYILLVVAMVTPAMAPVIERMQIRSYKTSPNTRMQPVNLFFTISIMKMAMVEATYIYGLVVSILTGEFVNMLYFYPIGIVWSLVHWPKREKYDRLVEKLRRR